MNTWWQSALDAPVKPCGWRLHLPFPKTPPKHIDPSTLRTFPSLHDGSRYAPSRYGRGLKRDETLIRCSDCGSLNVTNPCAYCASR